MGDSLIEGFILPVKVPLHANFRKWCRGEKWEVSDLLQATEEYGKEVGMVVDLTDSHRYYNPSDFRQKRIGTVFNIITLLLYSAYGIPYSPELILLPAHLKRSLNFKTKDGRTRFPSESRIMKVIDPIHDFHCRNPDKIILVHCYES